MLDFIYGLLGIERCAATLCRTGCVVLRCSRIVHTDGKHNCRGERWFTTPDLAPDQSGHTCVRPAGHVSDHHNGATTRWLNQVDHATESWDGVPDPVDHTLCNLVDITNERDSCMLKRGHEGDHDWLSATACHVQGPPSWSAHCVLSKDHEGLHRNKSGLRWEQKYY